MSDFVEEARDLKFRASLKSVLIKQHVNRGSGIEHYTAH